MSAAIPPWRTFTRAMLIEAVDRVQNVRPPRLHRQAKADIISCIARAMAAPADSSVRVAMETSLARVWTNSQE